MENIKLGCMLCSTIGLLGWVERFIDAEKYDEARILCEEVLRRNESKAACEVPKYLGIIASRKGRFEEAVKFYKAAIEQGCLDQPLVALNLSIALNTLGKYTEGWYWHSKRSASPIPTAFTRFSKPLFEWQESPAVVNIHAEQGDGDNLCFFRYFPMLVDHGYTVQYSTEDRLVKIAQDSLPDVKVIKFPVADENFDYHLPIGELPYVFNGLIPCGEYLKADPVLIEKYSRHKGKIGIAWGAGKFSNAPSEYREKFGHYKSVPDELAGRIMAFDPFKFVSLQVPGSPDLPEKPSWADTAALIANLDLVISADTSVAHAAGGLGKPVWVMMHRENSAFFPVKGPESPWYPNATVFRQQVAHDWQPVVDDILKSLQQRYRKAA